MKKMNNLSNITTAMASSSIGDLEEKRESREGAFSREKYNPNRNVVNSVSKKKTAFIYSAVFKLYKENISRHTF